MKLTWQKRISFEEFRARGPELLAPLEERGFCRREDLEETTGISSTLVYMATNTAFVFSLDYREQIVGGRVVAVRNGKPVHYYSDGYDDSIYSTLKDHDESLWKADWLNTNSSFYEGKSYLEASLLRDLHYLFTVNDTLLQDDPIPIEEIRERVERTKKAKQHAYNLESARIDSRDSWTDKDYVSFVALLEPYREELTFVELKKLEFAQTKVREGMSWWEKVKRGV